MRLPLSSALAIGLALAIAGLARGQTAEHRWTRAGSGPSPYDGGPTVRTLERSELRVHVGDVAGAERPEFDDSGWNSPQLASMPAGSGIFWVRWRYRIAAPEMIPPGFEITTPAACEVFWDGELVLRSGTVGRTRDKEVAGLLTNYGFFPDARRDSGEHVMALRMSNFHTGFAESGLGLVLLDPVIRRAAMQRHALFPAAVAGACLILATAAVFMWLWGVRRQPLLWLAGFNACAALMQLNSVGRAFSVYSAERYHVVSQGRVVTGVLAGAMLVGFVIEQFAVPHRRWIFGALVPLYAASVAWKSPLTSTEDRFFLAGCAWIALALAAWSAWQRRRGAWVLAGGLAITAALLAVDPIRYAGPDFIQAFFPAAAGMIAVFAFELHAERQRARESQLTAARLELELLKKNLQPHFLLNTLAVLTETVEQNPRAAVKLIDDLAGGFRSLARVSAEKLIPLGQELELCRAHLRVMSVRMGRAWSLEATGVDEAVLVPPAVFLTLIENGFAHQRAAEGATTFTLRSERAADGAIRYAFFSPGEVQIDPTRPAGGTGLRYVKARLEESFPGRWSLRGEPVAGGWQTVVEIRDNT